MEITKNSAGLLEKIDAAYARIRDDIYKTPIVKAKRISRQIACTDIFLKLENVQSTGSFKIRGAMNAVRLRQKKDATFVTASAGNHGLGVAYSAWLCGARAEIFMPTTTPLTKQRAVEQYTDKIHLVGKSFQETNDIALKFCAQKGCNYIHPYNDLDVVAGQGTMGLEIIKQMGSHPPDMVFVPVGGGGLIAGVATVLKQKWPRVKVIAVEPRNVPSFSTSLKRKKVTRITPKPTIADGVAVAQVGSEVFPINKELVDDVWLVSEEYVAKAIVRFVEDSRIVAEGAGACGLGAILEKTDADPDAVAGQRLLVIVSGGNLDINALSVLLQRGLVIEGRVSHYQFSGLDRPGTLAQITRSFAEAGVNILDLEHSRFSGRIRVGMTMVDVFVETRGPAHQEELLNHLKNLGHEVELIREI
jgi:threonine dehydratase